MAHDVFISHAAEDKTSADMLCATLEQQGVRCWVAPRDVRPGSDWRSAILAAIRESRAMVLVFSEHANESRHVNREVDCAIEAGIPVVPFRTQDVPPRGALEYSLYGVHWLDAVTPPLAAHTKRLAALLVAMLAGDARATHTLAGSPRTNTLGLSSSTEDGEHAAAHSPPGDPTTARRWLVIGGGAAALAVAISLTIYTYTRSPASTTAQPPAPIGPAADTAPTLTSGPGTETKPATDASAGLPATAPSAPADAIIFPTAQGELIWQVDGGHAGDFESVWKKLVDGLLRSTSADYQNAGRGLTAAKTGDPDKPIYVIHIDPVVPGVNYQAGYLLANSGSFEKQEIDALYKKLSDGAPSLRTVQLERISLLPDASTPIDQSPVMGMPKAKDAFAFSTDQGQIIWQLKPGKRPEFEAAWRTIVAGLLRSPNERVRAAALGIAAFRTQLDTFVIFRIDHVVKGVSYDPAQLMFYGGTFARPALDDLAAALRATIDGVTPWPLAAIR